MEDGRMVIKASTVRVLQTPAVEKNDLLVPILDAVRSTNLGRSCPTKGSDGGRGVRLNAVRRESAGSNSNPAMA